MAGKPIGKYLLEAGVCDPADMEKALEIQVSYRNQGVYKPLGSTSWISRKCCRKCWSTACTSSGWRS